MYIYIFLVAFMLYLCLFSLHLITIIANRIIIFDHGNGKDQKAQKNFLGYYLKDETKIR